jgi:hypothetical protein
LCSKKPIDGYRRTLQKSYVDKLSDLITPSSSGSLALISFSRSGSFSNTDISNTDVPAIARAQLLLLKNEVAKAISATSDRMSKIHLADLKERIVKALDAKK